MKLFFRSAAGSLLFAAFVPQHVSAQDHNYWNNQYGSRSALMSGAVVGGVSDTSAIYYNPGALGFITNDSLGVSANAFRYETTTLENGAGTGADLDSQNINVIPLLVSGVMLLGDDKKDVIGYGLLTRNSNKIKTSDRFDVIADVIHRDTFPGDENYIGQYNADTNLTEYWATGSYAHAVNDWLSLGISAIGAVRQESFNQSVSVRTISVSNATQVALTDDISNYDYLNGRLLSKVGAQAKLDPVTIGIAVTTPSVSIFGDGTTARDLSVTNVDFDGSGPISFVADDRQKNLDSEYKSPFSLAAGIDVKVAEGTIVAVSAEWFANVGRYKVLEPESREFLRPPGVVPTADFDAADFLQVSDAADKVFNVAIGIEQEITPEFKGVLSFSTDYSYARNFGGSGLPLGYSDLNLYHFTLGGEYKRAMSELSMGVQYTYGSNDDSEQVVDFSDPSESNFLAGQTGPSKVKYDAIGLVIGYTYFFR